MKRLRRILCALDWHCGETISTGPFAKFRCVFCGREEFCEDYVLVWRHRS